MPTEIQRAEQKVVESAEAFLATWQKVGPLENAYDAANEVVHAVRELRRARRRAAKKDPRK